MKIIKKNIRDENRDVAIELLKRLKNDERLFGTPAKGLKKTLKKLEDTHDEKLKSISNTEYSLQDDEYVSKRSTLKAGIKGEEDLAIYFEKIIKYDKDLQDIIIFASLSDPEYNTERGYDSLDYIPDSDFLLVYGSSILIIDAKNIRSKGVLYLDDLGVNQVGSSSNPILEVHSSIPVWKQIFERNNLDYGSVEESLVIVNSTPTTIWRNKYWSDSATKLIHISETVGFLKDWIKDKDPNTSLDSISTIYKMTIKEEKSLDIDIKYLQSVLKF